MKISFLDVEFMLLLLNLIAFIISRKREASLLTLAKSIYYSLYCYSDTGTSKTNYLLLVNSSSENFEKCGCTYRLSWDQVPRL